MKKYIILILGFSILSTTLEAKRCRECSVIYLHNQQVIHQDYEDCLLTSTGLGKMVACYVDDVNAQMDNAIGFSDCLANCGV